MINPNYNYKYYILDVDIMNGIYNPIQTLYAPIIEGKQQLFWFFNTYTTGVVYNGSVYEVIANRISYSIDYLYAFTFSNDFNRPVFFTQTDDPVTVDSNDALNNLNKEKQAIIDNLIKTNKYLKK